MQQVHHQLFLQMMQSVLVCPAAAAVVIWCWTQASAVFWETGGLGWCMAWWANGGVETRVDILKGAGNLLVVLPLLLLHLSPTGKLPGYGSKQRRLLAHR